MTGLEKIIGEIQAEAEKEAAAIIQDAKDEADKVLAAAKANTDAQNAKIDAGAKSDVADIERSRVSALALQRRQRTLQTKQELLSETLQKALDELHALPRKEYFDLLVKLAAASAEQGEGELLLNTKDAADLPADFESRLTSALPAGAKLNVSKTTRPIDGGFVLKYGDIEENCSFEAMFAARKEEFTDQIQGVLFG